MKLVLLVEDHNLFRQALAHLIERETKVEGIVQAGSVAEGRRHLGTLDGDIDMAIVDLDLPDRNGWGLIREMRQTGIDVPVLALTKSQDHARHARALEAGVAEVLTKAATVEEILAAVRRQAR
jgi:DNA-binding NarL/FixJ family response regulator